MEIEMLDIYDENRRLTGRTVARGEPIAQGEYVTVSLVWIVNSRGEILITLRSPEKEHCPNQWENPGGAVRAGETSLEGCMRELREETGIVAEASELTLLDAHRGWGAFFDTYAVLRNMPAEDVKLQEGETAGAMWVTVERLEEMCADGSFAAPIAEGYRRTKPALLEYMKEHME